MSSQAQFARSQDQRSSERVAVRLAGKLFVPAEKSTLECIIINLSVGGAGIHCPEPPPLDAFVVLYVEGFGRFDGVTTRYVNGELGLKFVCKEAKRKRLEQDLESFVKEGMTSVTRLRRHRRNPVNTSIVFFSRADGSQAACKLMDLSFQGAMLKTHVRPPIGEIVHLGQTRGWVVRHHEQGIGVQFQQPFEAGDER
ncbi:MAG TPA: PilZ domain-containing protein [Rhizomicrobium sp.]|nr:PilZ domain-containing protein [Rhizomicrobium sp.]